MFLFGGFIIQAIIVDFFFPFWLLWISFPNRIFLRCFFLFIVLVQFCVFNARKGSYNCKTNLLILINTLTIKILYMDILWIFGELSHYIWIFAYIHFGTDSFFAIFIDYIWKHLAIAFHEDCSINLPYINIMIVRKMSNKTFTWRKINNKRVRENVDYSEFHFKSKNSSNDMFLSCRNILLNVSNRNIIYKIKIYLRTWLICW